MTSVLQPLIAPYDVEVAALKTLEVWLPYYVLDLERKHSLARGTIPQPGVYRGGQDFETWIQDELPAVIVNANPVASAPELTGAGIYNQDYDVAVGSVIVSSTEHDARMIAGLYGAAVMGAIVQQGDLGGFAARTVMTHAPTVTLPDPDVRLQATSVCTFNVFVSAIVNESGGAQSPTPQSSPVWGGTPQAPFGDWPTVATEHITVAGEPITSP